MPKRILYIVKYSYMSSGKNKKKSYGIVPVEASTEDVAKFTVWLGGLKPISAKPYNA